MRLRKELKTSGRGVKKVESGGGSKGRAVQKNGLEWEELPIVVWEGERRRRKTMLLGTFDTLNKDRLRGGGSWKKGLPGC